MGSLPWPSAVHDRAMRDMSVTPVLTIAFTVITVVLPVAVLVHAIRRTRREPRRLSNAFWLLSGVFLVLQLAAGLGIPGAGLVQGLLFLLVVGAPVLIDVVAVFLIMNGITMLRRERRSLANLLSLLTGIALLALSLSPLLLLLGAPAWLLAVLVLVGLAAAYLGFVFVGFLLYSWLYPRIVRRRRARWVVVLGSGLVGGDRVPPLLAGRIAAGLTAYAERGAGVMIMSGGRGPDEKIAEAVAMAGWARENGADAERLLVEDRSRSTDENLRFTAELLAENRPPMPLRYPGEQRPVVRVPGWLDRVFGGPIAPDASEGLIVTSD